MRNSTLAIIATAGSAGGSPPPVGAVSTRWRVFVEEAGDYEFAAIQEIEMATVLGGGNVCSGGTVTTGTARPSFPGTEAFNGDKTSTSHGWSIDLLNEDPDDFWIEYEFASAQAIVELRMWSRNDLFYIQFPVAFRLEYFDAIDGWTVYLSHRWGDIAQQAEMDTYTADYDSRTDDSSKFWRVLAPVSENGTYIHIAELEMRDELGGLDLTDQLDAISGANRGGFEDTKAFDNIVSGNNSWGVLASANVDDRWVGQEFDFPVRIKEVKLIARADAFATQNPSCFAVQKRVNLTDWETQFYVQDARGTWSSSESRVYTDPWLPGHPKQVFRAPFFESLNDISASGHVASLLGNPSITRTIEPRTPQFDKCVHLDSTDDALVYAADADFDFADGDFTIEGCIRPSLIVDTVLISKWSAADKGWQIRVDADGNIVAEYSTDGTAVTTAHTIAVSIQDTWTHFAWSRIGTTSYFLVDGVSSSFAIGTDSINSSAEDMIIGSNADASVTKFEGYLSDFRIIKGEGVYSVTQDAPNPIPGAYTPAPPSFATKYVLFALMGQSNMVGRFGPIDGVLDATDPDVLMYQAISDTFVTAADPLDNFDETANTISAGLTFGKAFQSTETPVKTILVGCAEGGVGFIAGDILPNRTGSYYEDAHARWEAAYAKAVTDYGAENVVVGGVLWIQGEDEVIDYPTFFDSATGQYEYLGMPMAMFEIIRNGDFSGMDATTPIMYASPAEGTALTANAAANTQIQTAVENVGLYQPYAAFVNGRDLTFGDDRHYDAVAQRTLGARFLTGFNTARLNSLGTAYPTFVPDASNVETAFAFDAQGVPDYSPIRMIAGTYPLFENKRVYLSGGALQFDGDAEMRFSDGRQALLELTDRDFVLKGHFNTDTAAQQGIFSLYDTAGNNRSFVLRINSGPVLQFYGSTDGVSPTLHLEAAIATATDYEFEIRRVGTALELFFGGVSQDTAVLSGGYTFYTPSGLRTNIGDHINNNEFVGTMKHLSLEFLS